jgi:hypothetical protein
VQRLLRVKKSARARLATYDRFPFSTLLLVEPNEPREIDLTKVDIAEWQRRLDADGPPQPSPTILDARCTGCPSLMASCAACGHMKIAFSPEARVPARIFRPQTDQDT